MSNVFKSIGISTISLMLSKPQRATDIDMALNVLNLALSDTPSVCEDVISNNALLKVLILLATTTDENSEAKQQEVRLCERKTTMRGAAYTLACCISYARNMPLSAQREVDREEAMNKIINEGFVDTVCDFLDSLENPDHISDTLLLAALSVMVEASAEAQSTISARGTTVRVLVQIASGDNGWSGNRFICVPKYFDENMHVKDIALYILEKICIDKPACDRLAECNGARLLLSILLPQYFQSSLSQSGKSTSLKKRSTDVSTSEQAKVKTSDSVEGQAVERANTTESDEGQNNKTTSLVTQECISRILISCINNSSEFGRQFYRIAISMTPASSPSGVAVERFFSLLLNGTASLSDSPSGVTIIQLTKEDMFACQRLSLMVIRRAIIGPSARSGRTSLASQRNSQQTSGVEAASGASGGGRTSSSREVGSKTRRSSKRSVPARTDTKDSSPKVSPGTLTTVSKDNDARTMARRRSTNLSVEVSGNNKTEDMNKVLARQVALSLCSHGMLSSLCWLLLSSHSSIRDYSAQILQKLANVDTPMFSSVSTPSMTPKETTMVPPSPRSPLTPLSSSSETRSDVEDATGGISDLCLIPLLEQGCVPILILSVVMLKKTICHGISSKASSSEGTISTDKSKRSSARSSLVSSNKDTSDECIINVAESIVVRISTLLTSKYNENSKTEDNTLSGSRSAEQSAGTTPRSAAVTPRSAAVTPRTPLLTPTNRSFLRQNSTTSASSSPSRPTRSKRAVDVSDKNSESSVRDTLNSLVTTVGNVELRVNVAMGMLLLSRFSIYQTLNPTPLTNPLSIPPPSRTLSTALASTVESYRGPMNGDAGSAAFSTSVAPYLPHFKLNIKVVNAICDLMKSPKSYRMGICMLKCIDSLLLSPCDSSKVSEIYSPIAAQFNSAENSNIAERFNLGNLSLTSQQQKQFHHLVSEKLKAWDRYDLECKKLCLFRFVDINCAVANSKNPQSNETTTAKDLLDLTSAAVAGLNGEDLGSKEDSENRELKDKLWVQFLERKGMLKRKNTIDSASREVHSEEDMILLVCEEKEDASSDGVNSGHSIHDKGVKMNCPPLTKISASSAFLATVIACSQQLLCNSCLHHQDEDVDQDGIDEHTSRLPRLYGSYRVWEEIMSHIASNGQNFKDHSHMYSLDSLFSLLAVAVKYHISSLSTLYTTTIITSHLDTKSSPTVLLGAIKVKAFSLAVFSFRNVLSTFESKLNVPYKRSSDEKWERKAAAAIGSFLTAILTENEGVVHF